MKNTTEQRTNFPIEKTSSGKPDRDKARDNDRPLSACTIREITGIRDESLIQAILVSGASKREIQQAYDHCHGTHHTTLISKRPMTERIKHLSDLIDFGNGDID